MRRTFKKQCEQVCQLRNHLFTSGDESIMDYIERQISHFVTEYVDAYIRKHTMTDIGVQHLNEKSDEIWNHYMYRAMVRDAK